MTAKRLPRDVPASVRRVEARPRRFRRYPEYKESGVEWLREVPAHWDMKRLKTVAEVQLSNVDKHSSEGQVSVKLCNYVDVYHNDFITADLDFMSATATPAQVRRFRLRVGDVLITKDSESWTDIAVPAVVAEDLPDVLCGYHLAHIRPVPGVDGRYLARQFDAIGARDQFHVAANGITRFGLGGNAIRGSLFAVPPIDEQRGIADFLDRETAKIDALVTRKERVIELLQEKRTALITRAVTRGLDRNIPMRDSGVEWLGDIPAHWDVKRLGYVTNIGNGSTPNRNEERYWVDGVHPWLTSAKINEGLISTADQFVTDVALRECHLPRVPVGSILVAITGEGKTRGRAAVLNIDSTISQHLAYLTPCSPEVNPGFLVRLLEARYEWLRDESSGSGSTRGALTCEFLRSIRLAFPKQAEQVAIAAFLDGETAVIDAAIARIREAIDYFNEFRTALISAAVTGKVDAREAASR